MAEDTPRKATYVSAVGRRKESIARVRVIKGGKDITVNGKPYSEYFVSLIEKDMILRPFELTKSKDYGATVLVAGGGMSAQLDAVVHGLARGLSKVNLDMRKSLKIAGLLTRDPRAKERRKYGLAGKARAKKQSPKR